MSTLSHKLVAVCLVAAFSMVMYGCGGGGGSSSVPDVMPEEPTGPTAEEMAAATAAMTAANEAATAANEAATAANDAVSAATLVADTMAASDAATAATTAAMAATAAAAAVDAADSATVDAANAAATAATMAAMTANTAASDLNTAQANAVAEAERLAMAKAAAERMAGLIGPEPKLADANDQTDGNQSIVTLTTPPDDDNFSEPAFATVDADGSTPVMFMHTDDPAMIDGWTRGTYTHTSEDGMTTHTVVMYNDKAADEAEAYSTFFTTNTAESTTHRAGLGVSAVAETGVLTIANGEVGANHGLFSGDFGPTTEGTFNFPRNAEIAGMFRGVPGTFECTDPCASMHDEDGNLSGLTGTWEFEPDGIRTSAGALLTNADDGTDNPVDALTDALAAIMVAGVKQDDDFMIFGYWEQSVTDDEGTEETMLPFADGKRDYGAVSTVTGTAKYTGPATGLYIRKTLTSQGLVDTNGPYASGQFTAEANLDANFGGGNVADNHQFSVTGTISSFKDGYGADIDTDWTVNLNRRMIGTDGDEPQRNIGAADDESHGTGGNDMFSGMTDGGMLDDPSNVGAWSGQFHGDTAANTDNAPPVSASGTFDGHFTNGHVRGAFATNRQAE